MMTEQRDARLLCLSVCCNDVGYGGVELDGQDKVNIFELILWDMACRRWRTEVMRALAQLMVLRVVVGLVSATSVLIWGKVLYLMVLALGKGW